MTPRSAPPVRLCPGLEATALLTSEQGAPVGVYLLSLDQGKTVTHAHPNLETIVAFAPLFVTIAGITHELKEGWTVDVPANVEHAIENRSVVPFARYLSVATPDWPRSGA